MRPILAFSLVSLLACSGAGTPASEYHEDLLPQEDKLKINLPVDDASKANTENGFAEYYATTRVVTEHVNGLITFVLGTVGYVTTLEPQWSDTDANTAVWGPWSDSGLDPVETGLWVRSEDDGSYSWAIFQLPKGGDIETESVVVVAGIVDAGSTRDDASGEFYVDFNTLSEMDPAVRAGGEFAVEYAYDVDGVIASAAFDDYGDLDGERYDALYSYDEDYAGAGSMDLAWLQDINANGTEELHVMRTRWLATGDGRSDAALSGGDLGETAAYASECWGSDFSESYWSDTVGYQEPVGDVSVCAFADQELPTEASFGIIDGE